MRVSTGTVRVTSPKKPMKPSYVAVVLCLVINYFLLYLFLLGKSHDYYFLAPGIRTGVDLVY